MNVRRTKKNRESNPLRRGRIEETRSTSRIKSRTVERSKKDVECRLRRNKAQRRLNFLLKRSEQLACAPASHRNEYYEYLAFEISRLPLPPELIRYICGGAAIHVIANNTTLNVHLLNETIDNRDICVVFNGGMEWLSRLKGRKWMVYRAKGTSSEHHGFDREHFIQSKFEYVSFTRNMPAEMKSVLTTLNPKRISLIPEWHNVWETYNIVKGVRYTGPSSGYLTVKLLAKLKNLVENLYSVKVLVILHGFEDTGKRSFWEGHNWQFERAELSNMSDQGILTRE